MFKRIKSVSASCRGSDSDLVSVHVCGGLSLQTILLSRVPATQQAQMNKTLRLIRASHHDIMRIFFKDCVAYLWKP